MHITLTACRSA
uniref:Uncharacterized protein n=1 Tax=Anguilla anguilla TaxID=7936 RepID=A0A0E9QJR4_ANGAN